MHWQFWECWSGIELLNIPAPLLVLVQDLFFPGFFKPGQYLYWVLLKNFHISLVPVLGPLMIFIWLVWSRYNAWHWDWYENWYKDGIISTHNRLVLLPLLTPGGRLEHPHCSVKSSGLHQLYEVDQWDLKKFTRKSFVSLNPLTLFKALD
jgi:hypothetical protein